MSRQREIRLNQFTSKRSGAVHIGKGKQTWLLKRNDKLKKKAITTLKLEDEHRAKVSLTCIPVHYHESHSIYRNYADIVLLSYLTD